MQCAHSDDVGLPQVVDFHLNGTQMVHPSQLSTAEVGAVEALEALNEGEKEKEV